MLIKRRCPVTGVDKEMEIDVTVAQLAEWQAGKLIQNAMPTLTPSEREFIMTGITDDVWDKIFEKEEDSLKGER